MFPPYTEDPVRDAESNERHRYNRLIRRPCCCECGDPIEEEFAFSIGDDWYCGNCMDDHYIPVPDDDEE